MTRARLLVELRAEDAPRRARTPIWAYGIGYVATISGRSRKTASRAKRLIDMSDPVEVVAWALARKRPDLADQVLVEFGRPARYHQRAR